MVERIAQIPFPTELKLNETTFDPQKNTAAKSQAISEKTRFAETHYGDEHSSKYLAGVAAPLPQISIPDVVKEDVYQAIDKLGKSLNRPSISRRMLQMNHLMAELAEKHIAGKKDEEFKKKQKIKTNVHDQQSWTNWQASFMGMGGLAAPVLSVVGVKMGGAFGDGLVNIARPVSELLSGVPTKVIDGAIKPLHHEESFWINTLSSEKQSLEGLKNLPEQLRQFILEISRAEQKAYESMGQMR